MPLSPMLRQADQRLWASQARHDRGNVAYEQGQFGVAISPANMTAILADIRTHIGDNPGLG